MIVIRQEDPGQIAIDFSGEPGFDILKDGVELTSGLFVREFRPQSIVVEDAGQLSSVSSFIRDFLVEKGYKFEFDKQLERTLRLIRDEELLVDAVRKGSAKPLDLAPPAEYGIKRPLLSHQRHGVFHAVSIRHAANFSVPGSGKTAIALAVYAVLQRLSVVDRLLVVGPASSFDPWEEEFRLTFGRPPRTARLVGARAQRAEILRYLEGVDFILCTYQMAYRERESLAKTLQQARYFFVLDESHHIKNIELGPWARTAIELAPLAERRMILTGTPAPHSPRDLWAQFTFLWPTRSVVGSRLSFEQRLQSSAQPIETLKRAIGPFFKRTRKSDLKLPKPLSHFVRVPYADIPKRQRLIVRLLELKTIQQAKELGLSKLDLSILRAWRRARAIRLLQAASNPALLRTTTTELGNPGEPLDGDPAIQALLQDYLEHETPAKIRYVVEKTEELVKQGNKVVIWAYFVENLRLLQKLLIDLNPLLVFGEVPPYEEDDDPDFENRERNIREFKDRADRPVLVANPSACSESISLHTVCHHAIYLERTFNCGQFLQSMDRIHRVGMPKDVNPHYYVPLISCAVERVVVRRLRDRQNVLYALLDDDLPVLGYEDESLLLEREDDLELIFRELSDEISKGRRHAAVRELGRGRSRR